MTRLIRAAAFLRKELAALLRQPRLVILLVAGPFLILGAFGAGLSDTDPRLPFTVVAPSDGPLRTIAEEFVGDGSFHGDFVEVTDDRLEALTQLRRGELGLVIDLPDEPAGRIRRGEHAVVRVYHTRLDPLEARAVQLATRRIGDLLNDQVSRGVVVEIQEVAADIQDTVADVQEQVGELEVLAGQLEDSDSELQRDLVRLTEELETFAGLPPQVVASPFRGVADRVGPGFVSLTDFYAPAVIVLLVQHMVLSFAGLSTVRDDELGATELFRVAPVTAGEILFGKFMAYLLIGVVVTLLSVGLMVLGLDVPLRGGIALLVVGAAVSVAAAVAVGFLLALLARTDSQAVQYAMLVLLSSIFFSGFIISLERFVPPLDRISLALPATYGVQFFRGVMLQGAPPVRDALLPLLGITTVAAALSWLLLRRRLQPS